MRILITGAGGFVGARVAADLADAGHDVIGIWRHSRDRVAEGSPAGIVYRQLDLTDARSVDALFQDIGEVDAIIHAAAKVAGGEITASALDELVQANIAAMGHLLLATSRFAAPRVVFTSSISVYGQRGALRDGYRESDARPTEWYGWTKLAGEQALAMVTEATQMTAVSLRLAGVHGAGRNTGALAAITRAARSSQTIAIAEPHSQFRWAFIEDVSQAISKALTASLEPGHHVLNLASRETFSLAELAARVVTATGSASAIEEARSAPQRREFMNIDRSIDLLGYVPSNLDSCLEIYLAAVGGR